MAEADEPQAARDLLDEMERRIGSLADYPEQGRVVPELGPPRRELVVKGHRVI